MKGGERGRDAGRGEEKGPTGTGMARSACWKLLRAPLTNEKFTRPLMHHNVITYHRPAAGLQESIRVRFTGCAVRSVTRETVKRRGEQTRQAFVRWSPGHSRFEEPEERNAGMLTMRVQHVLFSRTVNDTI